MSKEKIEENIHEDANEQKEELIKIVLTIILLIALYVLTKTGIIGTNGYLRLGLFLVPYLIIGFESIKEAVEGIKEGELLDENFLMVLATVGAFTLATIDKSGDYFEAVFVMLFYKIGEFFEDYAVDRSRENITSLMDLRPDSANLVTKEEAGEVIRSVSPEEVAVGSMILVATGEKIPIDGVIAKGSSYLDTAALTGESVPRKVKKGDEVLSGCINAGGVLYITTTKEFGQSTVSRILELVENASDKKAKSENFITRFAKVYTPSVCGMALFVAVGIPLLRMLLGYDANFIDFLYRALTFLVISCPCALVIGIPLSFFAGIGGAGKSGILIKGSNYIEALSKVDTVVFDKTGTLTKGEFEVTQIVPAGGELNDILMYSAYSESFSSHPIAQSIIKAYGKEIKTDEVTNVTEHAGMGISACVSGRKCLVGNERLMEENHIDFVRSDESGTKVYVALDGKYLGVLVIADSLKPDAKESVHSLNELSITNTVMLTGDEEKAAKAVADELSIKTYYAGLLPQDKVTKIEELHEKKTAFVGDGINDAPVLMRADVGIAMGALGSDAAIEAADVVLMDDNPLGVARAVKISRKCMRIVYENIGFALGVKGICLILGALGFVNMWLAIFADVGVMVIAVINALRSLFVEAGPGRKYNA